jgi:uncharacterized OB-fold protein
MKIEIRKVGKQAKAICEKCGYVMNVPKSYSTLCYDCTEERK